MQSEQPDREWQDVDELLTAAPSTSNPALRERLLQRTSMQLRRRRLSRVAVKFAALAACFAGGMGAMALFRPDAAPTMVVAVATAVPPGQTDAAPAPERRLTPAQIELEAEQAMVKEDCARQFREAGDRYLRDEDNYGAALRCYRNFLDEAGAAGLVAAPSDTWLLASLKNARTKETN
jgi:hypothetical protein